MKKTGIILGFFLLVLNFSFAQNHEVRVQQDTEKLAAIYNLTPQQKAEMTKIQQLKQQNLQEVEAIKTSDPETFNEKMKSISYGTDMAIRRMLEKDQLKVYREIQINKRTQKASIMSEMTKGGASKAEIQKALQAVDLSIE